MQTKKNDLSPVISFNESFDCNKLKSLMQIKSISLGEKLNRWLKACVLGARTKITADLKKLNVATEKK